MRLLVAAGLLLTIGGMVAATSPAGYHFKLEHFETPSKVAVGETFRIAVTASNPENVSGTASGMLFLAGRAHSSISVTLHPNETRVLVFENLTWPKDEIVDAIVRLGLIEIGPNAIVVGAPPPAPPPPPPLPRPACGANALVAPEVVEAGAPFAVHGTTRLVQGEQAAMNATLVVDAYVWGAQPVSLSVAATPFRFENVSILGAGRHTLSVRCDHGLVGQRTIEVVQPGELDVFHPPASARTGAPAAAVPSVAVVGIVLLLGLTAHLRASTRRR